MNIQQLELILDNFKLYTPDNEQQLRGKINDIQNILNNWQLSQDETAKLTTNYFSQLFNQFCKEKFNLLQKQDKQQISNLSVVQVVEQINHIISEENVRAQNILDGLKSSTDVMKTIGLTHNQISSSISKGSALTHDIKEHEAKDKLLVLGLFLVFVLTSIIIVIRRIKKVLKILFFFV